jgi:hypothetical protein
MGTRVYACKTHENRKPRDLGGLGVGEAQVLCLFVDIKQERSGDCARGCVPRLALALTESDTSKIHEGELCRGNLRRTNDS